MLNLQMLLFFVAMLESTRALGLPKITKLEMIPPFPLFGGAGEVGLLQLDCLVTGDPMPDITWFFKGKLIDGGACTQKKSPGKNRLICFTVTEASQGVYRCEANNKYGTIFNEINVKIFKMGKFNSPYGQYDPPRNLDAHVGKPLEIKCPPHDEGTGNSYVWGDLPQSGGTPTLWKIGTEPITKGFYDEHGSLIFSTLTRKEVDLVNDMGGVSCILYRSMPLASVKTRLVVKSEVAPVESSPEFRRSIPDKMTGITGTDKKLVCGAIGYPHPQITWFKDGVVITKSSGSDIKNSTLSGHGMVLTIRSITLLAEGKYKCVAENSQGKIEKEGFLTVHSAPHFKTDMDIKQTVTYDESLTLNCDGAGVPQVSFKWYHNGTVLNSNEDYVINGGKLTMSKADFNHGGLYLCLIRNYLSIAVQPVYVIVDAIPPSLTKGLEQPTYIFKDEDSTLTCKFNSAPVPVITWSKDGNAVTVGDSESIVLKNVQDKDSGEYICSAKNVKGEDSDKAKVIAVVKTVITKKPAHLTKKVGTKLMQLYCDAVYEKILLKVTFEWLRDGKPFTPNDRVYPERRLSGISRILFFNNLQQTDAGEYTCRVYTADKNTKKIVSEDTSTGSITAIGKPKTPMNGAINGSCSNSTSTITLSWKQENYFGHKISYYVLEFAGKQDSGQESWIQYESNKKITDEKVDIEVKKLPASADLMFRVKAVIEFNGEIFTSDPAYIDGQCATPGGAPIWVADVKSESNGPGSLIVSWNDPDDVMASGPGFKIVVSYRKLPDGEVVEKTVTDGNKLVIEDAGENQEYEVIVHSKNDYGDGPKSTAVLKSSGPEIKSAPTNINVKFDDKNVIFTWNPVTHATKYKLYYKVGDENKRRMRRDGHDDEKSVEVTDTNANLTDLKSQTHYKYQVSAANGYMEGPRSGLLDFQTKANVPKAPLNADVNIVGHAIHVKWSPPPKERPEVTGYLVTYYKDGDKSNAKTIECDKDCREIFIKDGLDPFSYYTVELQAKNEIGAGGVQKFDGLAVSTIDVPGKPLPPFYTNVNETTMNVNFNLPTKGYIGGLPENFTIFYYRYGQDKRDAKSVTRPFPSQENITVYHLADDPYILYAVGINSAGPGQESDTRERNPVKPLPPPVPARDEKSKAFYEELWFLILIIIIALIILLALIICCCCSRRGGKYPVDEKEKKRGGWDNAPLKDYSQFPIEDEPAEEAKNGKEPVRSASQNSLKAPFDADEEDDDKDSLDDYGEDTNIIGQYGGEDEKKPASKTNGNTAV